MAAFVSTVYRIVAKIGSAIDESSLKDHVCVEWKSKLFKADNFMTEVVAPPVAAVLP